MEVGGGGGGGLIRPVWATATATATATVTATSKEHVRTLFCTTNYEVKSLVRGLTKVVVC